MNRRVLLKVNDNIEERMENCGKKALRGVSLKKKNASHCSHNKIEINREWKRYGFHRAFLCCECGDSFEVNEIKYRKTLTMISYKNKYYNLQNDPAAFLLSNDWTDCTI